MIYYNRRAASASINITDLVNKRVARCACVRAVMHLNGNVLLSAVAAVAERSLGVIAPYKYIVISLEHNYKLIACVNSYNILNYRAFTRARALYDSPWHPYG